MRSRPKITALFCVFMAHLTLFCSLASAATAREQTKKYAQSQKSPKGVQKRDPQDIANQAVDFRNQLRSLLPLLRGSQLDGGQKAEIRRKLLFEYQKYQKDLGAHLEELDVRYEWLPHPDSDLKEVVGQKTQALFVALEGDSQLNHLAQWIKTNWDVRLVYDPVARGQFMGVGAYHRERQIIYLNDEVGYSATFDIDEQPTLEHEMIHARYDAARRGLIDYGLTHPVHIQFENTRVGLSRSFSMEELVGHAVNVRHAGHGGGSLRLEAKTLLAYAKAALESVELALAQVEGGHFEWQDRPDKYNLIIFEGGGLVGLRLFVPPDERAQARRAPKPYLNSRLERARRLAKFSLEYFSGMDLGSSEAKLKAQEFQREQLKILDSQ